MVCHFLCSVVSFAIPAYPKARPWVTYPTHPRPGAWPQTTLRATPRRSARKSFMVGACNDPGASCPVYDACNMLCMTHFPLPMPRPDPGSHGGCAAACDDFRSTGCRQRDPVRQHRGRCGCRGGQWEWGALWKGGREGGQYRLRWQGDSWEGTLARHLSLRKWQWHLCSLKAPVHGLLTTTIPPCLSLA